MRPGQVLLPKFLRNTERRLCVKTILDYVLPARVARGQAQTSGESFEDRRSRRGSVGGDRGALERLRRVGRRQAGRCPTGRVGIGRGEGGEYRTNQLSDVYKYS